MNLSRQNDLLVVVDLSAWLYVMIFNAVTNYLKRYKTEATTLIKPPEETDQDNLPDLCVSDNFKKELKKTVIAKCHSLDWILKSNCQDLLDTANNVWIVLAEDDYVSRNFRRELYPEYKGTRAIAKHSYNTHKIRSYILNVLFPELELESKFGYIRIGCEGAEADDIIACIMKNLNGYLAKILISADRDFCQLEGVRQYNMFGEEVHAWLDKKKGMKMDPKTYLLVKILQGDGSDNIPQVFPRCGTKTAYKLAKDPAKLRQMLSEDASAAKQFLLNKKLISFNYIPETLTDKIMQRVNEKLKSSESESDKTDLAIQSLMEL